MGDDASMASGHMMMDGDDDNTRSSSSTSNPDMKNNCFNQIQSRRFHRSSNHVPIFGSFCPSMDLIAIGMRSGSGGGGGASTTGGSNTNTTLDGLLAANDTIAPVGGGGSAVCSSSTNNNNHDDEFAESIVVHRILSWQSLLHLKLTQLTSSPTNDSFDTLDANNSSSSSSNNNNEEDDNDNGILCSEDIERACINAINTTAKLGVNSNSNEDNTMNKHPPSSSMQLKSSLSIGISSCRVEEDYEMKTKEKKKNYGATCIIWSPDGRYIAIGLVDGGVLIHSIEPDAVRADCIGGGSSSGGGNNGVGGGGTRGLGGDNDDDDDEGNPSAAGLHFIRPPSTRHRSLLTQLCKMKPRLQHQSLPRQVEHDEQPAEAAASINRRVTRSMAEKREGSAVGEKTKLSVASSSTTSSSKEISSLAQQSPTTFPSVAVGVAPVIGMAWNQLLPLKRRRWRRRHLGQRTASASQVYDEENNISMEDVKYAEDEMDIRETWRYASQLIDKGIGHFLPSNCQPSSTAKTITFQHQQQQRSGLRRGWGDGGDGLVAHLNVLCVATTEDIHWYLQGQYRLLSIPHGFSLLSSQERNDNECSSSSGGGVDGISMICSPDLSTLLAVVTSQQQSASCTSSSTNKNVAKLFRTSLLPRQRFELQFLSATYRSLFSHLWDARRSIRAVLVSWKTALRPLDLKFSGLVKLLSDYGVERPIARDDSGVDNSGGGGGSDSIRLEFLRFILSGRSSVSGGNDSSSSSSTSAALDQFFTRPQMHDMLLQKEFRGVEVSLSSTEVILRSRALHSIRAIVYEAEELYGMACAWDNQEIHSSSGDLIDVNTALNLYNASRVLYLSFNQCLGYIVEARTRLNDLLAWVRGTAARVRAWGTAPDSIQRKNAKALRVSNGVIQRVAAFLSSPMMFASKDGTAKVEHRTLTECIIGVPLSDFLVQRKLHQTSMPSDRGEYPKLRFLVPLGTRHF